MIRIKKMDNASESIRELREEIEAQCDALNGTYGMDAFDACGIRELLYDALEKVVDDYNELEAKYQKQCGMISEYEEECQKDGEFAKFIGNRIVECIKQGAEHGYYEVHPLNRFDIHIEETSLTPMPDRHAIPKIAVQCNNVQTEMERDTAQHECEELESTVDSVTRERNHFEYTLNQLIEQLKFKNDVYVDIDECVNGNYKVENKRAADLQSDLDAAIYDLKKEEENAECLKKQIIRKNTEMCNLKWEHDETEKKFKILIEELTRLYGIHVTFYQKPGIDMRGLRNFGVNVDCEENRKAFNELKEKLRSAEDGYEMYRNSYERTTDDVRKLLEFLKRYGVPVKYRNDDNTWYWDFENRSFNKAWEDTLMKDCKLIDKCRKLEAENKELKKKLNAIYGYRDTDNPCAICKNFDPKE